MRDSSKRKYKKEWLQYERQQPMYDDSINDFYRSIYKMEPVKNKCPSKASTDKSRAFVFAFIY